MMRWTIALTVGVCADASVVPIHAQSPKARSFEQIEAALDAHKADFDFLLGDWEFDMDNREGRFRGRWSAVRFAETGEIMDEFRMIGDSGRTTFVSTTHRAYNAVLDRWDLVGVDNRGTGLGNIGTAQRDGDEMLVEQRFGVGTPNTWMSRIRYHDMKANSFEWKSDRSFDGGKTWIVDYQYIHARRIGPPRTFPALTQPGVRTP